MINVKLIHESNVPCLLATINALRTASFSSAMVSVTTIPDIEFS